MKTTETQLDAAMMRYLPYLSEVRKRLLFVFAVFFVAWVVGFIYYRPIVLFIMGLFNLRGVNIAFTSPLEFISLATNMGFLLGMSLALPMIIFQLFSFLKPALQGAEKRLILSLIPFSIILFMVGFGFGTWIMELVITIFSQRTAELSIENLWDINRFISQIVFTSMLLGILFQLPVVLTILLRLGLIKYPAMTKQRPLIYTIGIILVALLPPTDIFSLVLMFLPVAFLFEFTLFLNRHLGKELLPERR